MAAMCSIQRHAIFLRGRNTGLGSIIFRAVHVADRAFSASLRRLLYLGRCPRLLMKQRRRR